jgi:hydroxypyruvate isomerase
MPKLAANLTMMFGEVPFLDRFAAAASAGFKGVEYLFPYDHLALVLKQKLHDHGLVQVLHNLPAGHWGAGERGIACLPDRVDEFKRGVDQAIEYASALECDRVNCLAGILPQGVSADAARETFTGNLRYAAPRLAEAGIKLLIEAINTRDIPGFFLSNTRQAVDVIEAVGSDNLFVQYDIYHMQIMEGHLAKTIEAHLPRIAHMQLAEVPGRHEPGTGEIDYGFLLDFIDRAGYDGWIGCEYIPKAGTVEGLGWTKPYLERAK